MKANIVMDDTFLLKVHIVLGERTRKPLRCLKLCLCSLFLLGYIDMDTIL